MKAAGLHLTDFTVREEKIFDEPHVINSLQSLSEVQMQVIWDNKYRYKAFVHRPIQRLTVDSSHLTEEGVCKELAGLLFIVTDNDHMFCDLELITDENSQSGLIAFPGNYRECSDKVRVEIPENEDVWWNLDGVTNDLIISIGKIASDWVRLGDSSIWLGVDDMRLAGLYVKGVINDDSSSEEAAWLNEIK